MRRLALSTVLSLFVCPLVMTAFERVGSAQESSPLVVTLSTESTTVVIVDDYLERAWAYRRGRSSESDPTVFEPIRFTVRLYNAGEEDILVVVPRAYRIFPHPWLISVDGISIRLWSGSPMCAPAFTEDHIITLGPGESNEQFYTFSRVSSRFPRHAGVHTFSMSYDFSPEVNHTIFASIEGIPALRSAPSNTVEIEFVEE